MESPEKGSDKDLKKRRGGRSHPPPPPPVFCPVPKDSTKMPYIYLDKR